MLSERVVLELSKFGVGYISQTKWPLILIFCVEQNISNLWVGKSVLAVTWNDPQHAHSITWHLHTCTLVSEVEGVVFECPKHSSILCPPMGGARYGLQLTTPTRTWNGRQTHLHNQVRPWSGQSSVQRPGTEDGTHPSIKQQLAH